MMPSRVDLNVPAMADGAPFFSPCMFPSGVYLYITGAGDGTDVGNGSQFTLESDVAEDAVVEFSFLDWVLAAGGGTHADGAQLGDWVSLEVYCPATPVTPNGSGTGNCNVVSGIVIPAAGDGAYDLDLEQANPVLTPAKDGYWEWDFPDTGRGNVSIGVPGDAAAHLIVIDQPLMRFVNRAPLSLDMNFTIPAIEPKIVLPHWKGRVVVHNTGHAGLKATWYVTIARKRTC